MKLLTLEIFNTPHSLPITPPYRELFGGWLFFIQTHNFLPVLGGLIVLMGGVWCCRPGLNDTFRQRMTLILLCLTSILISLRLSQGNDEMFVNLRHSYVFALTNHFSCNIHEMVEGTVDFLPFLFIGLLGKCGLPLVETALMVSVFGNVLLITAVWRIARTLTRDADASILTAAAVALLPCVCFVGATGFMATLFTGWIFWIFDFLFFGSSQRRRIGWILLALLPLVRIEGVVLAALIWVWMFRDLSRHSSLSDYRSAGETLFWLLLPFTISLFVRKFAFGHYVPMPIPFKFTEGDFDFAKAGAHQFIDLITMHRLIYFGVLIGITTPYWAKSKAITTRPILVPFGLIFLFTMLYYSGGGDWLPDVWARYMVPLAAITVVTAMLASFTLLPLRIKKRWTVMGGMAFIAFAPFCVPYSSTNAYAEMIYNLRRTDSYLQSNWNWRRVDELASLGLFFDQTLSRDAVIGSPEVAATMYYANRDLLDLFGIVNPEVAYAPLNPFFPGNILHRRRNPATIDRHRPAVLCFNGATAFRKSYVHDEASLISEARTDFARYYQLTSLLNGLETAQYRAGRLEHLQKMGYRFIIVSTPDAFFNYLILAASYPEHVKKLEQLGFKKIGQTTIPYKINPYIDIYFP